MPIRASGTSSYLPVKTTPFQDIPLTTHNLAVRLVPLPSLGAQDPKS